MLDIKKLRYFTKIVEAGGFSEAARKLYVSQPNLSKTVKNLEEHLETKLFYMDGNRAKLTEDGKNLYRLAREAIEQYDNVFDEMMHLKQNARGTVNLGIPPIIGTCVLPGMLSAFYKKYPGIRLRVDQRAANSVQTNVLENKLDVGFTITPVISDAFRITPIVEDKNMLILHRSHRYAKRKSIGYAALKNENFITLNDEYTLYRNIMTGCYDAHFEPRILLKLSQWDLVVKLVKENMGISILPRRILEYYPEPEVAMVDLNHRSAAWNVVMITNSNRYVSPAVKRFTDFVADYFEKVD